MSASQTLDEREEHEQQLTWFLDFLEKNKSYQQKLKDQYEDIATRGPGGVIRLEITMSDLEKALDGLSGKIRMSPAKYLVPFEEAAYRWAIQGESGMQKFSKCPVPIRIAFTGAFGRHHITPRGLSAEMVTKLVTVEGIVTRTGCSHPKMLMSVHYCPATGETRTREHPDPCSLRFQNVSSDAPKADENNNKFQAEMGLSYFKDVLSFNIQEMPEVAPSGQIPRSVEVRCDQDLTDIPRPGARVRVTGVYKAYPSTDSRGITNGHFPCRIVANNIQLLSEHVNKQVITPEDIATCREISRRPDCIELLTRSMAPSICGHEAVKRGLLLLMAGGAEKNLANGTHLRGDLNLLLIGDPSCGKSQMLRFVMNIAKLSVSTTGRGSSGVGLTASVNICRRTGERRLEAGAMVLADRGIVCIDEFDKMGVNDRVAIHEVMEQQTVTIAKAGIHTTLNARCSVLAAANPIYSNFDDSQGLTKNINLPDSLLSRFDLIFIVRDLNTTDIDRKIASQVLQQARYCAVDGTGEAEGEGEFHDNIHERKPGEDQAQAKKDTDQVFEMKKFSQHEILTVNFLKKYLDVIARREPPALTEKACLLIGATYTDLRQRVKNSPNKENELSVTTRCLESLIRIATAIAKLRMKEEVTAEDADLARKIMFETRGFDAQGEQEQPAPMADDPELPPPTNDPAEEDDASKKEEKGAQHDSPLTPSRVAEFQVAVGKIFSQLSDFVLSREELLSRVNDVQKKVNLREFSLAEYNKGVVALVARNKLVEDNGNVYMVA